MAAHITHPLRAPTGDVLPDKATFQAEPRQRQKSLRAHPAEDGSGGAKRTCVSEVSIQHSLSISNVRSPFFVVVAFFELFTLEMLLEHISGTISW